MQHATETPNVQIYRQVLSRVKIEPKAKNKWVQIPILVPFSFPSQRSTALCRQRKSVGTRLVGATTCAWKEASILIKHCFGSADLFFVVGSRAASEQCSGSACIDCGLCWNRRWAPSAFQFGIMVDLGVSKFAASNSPNIYLFLTTPPTIFFGFYRNKYVLHQPCTTFYPFWRHSRALSIITSWPFPRYCTFMRLEHDKVEEGGRNSMFLQMNFFNCIDILSEWRGSMCRRLECDVCHYELLCCCCFDLD